MSEYADPEREFGRDARLGDSLGDTLIGARRDKGLELTDIAEVTHVRKEYLQALEEGRYQDLPEDVYAKNFLRLYAQAVGLDEGRVLALFNQETHLTPSAPGAHRPAPEKPPRGGRRGLDLGGLLPTLLLIAIIILLALWGFNRTLFRGGTSAATETTSSAASSLAKSAGANTAERLVKFSLTSTPPGAQVSVDGYVLAGITPLVGVPVTAGKERLIKVSLAGYQTETFSADLSHDVHLSVTLAPAPPPTSPQASQGAASEATITSAAAQNMLELNITAESWLEVYKGQARAGQPLVYRTAKPGETFQFPLPVYVHVGNAGGVQVTLEGQDKGAMGSSGEVLSHVFTSH
jgi:cytoskeleton protein RodZ